MTTFLQLHALTSYPPANLNRDDLGRPKTAVVGGATRLRISSQSLKRAWRTSEVFTTALGANRGWRTREIGKRWVEPVLKAAGVTEKLTAQISNKITEQFGKLDDKEGGTTKQIAHISPVEREVIEALAHTLATEQRLPTEAELNLLRADHRAADIALFGRMLADKPSFNIEAAAQVAHAITVHRVAIEDDFFTAVDDLNDRQDDAGAGHVGETEFAAGLFYLYICVDLDRLSQNLGGDSALLERTLRALAEAICTVAPAGKQNSFGSRAYASFVLAERGARQPRSLSVAFLEPLGDNTIRVREAADKLDGLVESFDRAYGPLADRRYKLDVDSGQGTLDGLAAFAAGVD